MSKRYSYILRIRKKKAAGNHSRFFSILIVVLMLCGLGILLYPTISEYWNAWRESRVIMDYTRRAAEISDRDYELMLEAAREYNRRLLLRGQGFVLGEEERMEYEALLSIEGSKVMAYVSVPGLGLSLPIYHGTSESVLQEGVGHLEWTSLPVGGDSCHAVLSGHRGLPGKRLFTDLDRLKIGDIFKIYVLNLEMTYEVDDIKVVLPEEAEALKIIKGQDYCTLMTCTPYGINTHRMLIRGHRTDS